MNRNEFHYTINQSMTLRNIVISYILNSNKISIDKLIELNNEIIILRQKQNQMLIVKEMELEQVKSQATKDRKMNRYVCSRTLTVCLNSWIYDLKNAIRILDKLCFASLLQKRDTIDFTITYVLENKKSKKTFKQTKLTKWLKRKDI